MSGLHLIQVAICICFMDGFDGQPLYEDKCHVDEMYRRFNEAYNRDVLLQGEVDSLKNQLDSFRGFSFSNRECMLKTVEISQFHLGCLIENGTYYEENVLRNQYCFIKSSMTWDDAKTKCQSFKSYLLEINSKAEQDSLKDKGGLWWTGAKKDTNKNIWVWDHSDTELVFSNWDQDGPQPNGGKKENCVLSKFGLWHDFPCQQNFNIICERKE